jgi:alpha-ketoglutaric semialdehyde dehydrogenase
MPLQPILIDGAWRAADSPSGDFRARDPATREWMEERYPVSRWADLEAALRAAARAVVALRDTPPEAIADFLDRYAANVDQCAGEIIAAAHQETRLPSEPRLKAELPRTTNQLRQAAAAAREGSWRLATIDSANNLRSYYAALGGAVVVIGPNNFPLAFNGISGGDFAAAVAAGNPVIVKGHPNHPRTTRLLAEAAHEALAASGVPKALVQLVYHFAPEDGLRLVAAPEVAATAFTGSRRTGLALKAAAEQAGKLIYLEMSSLNPVFVLPGALEERLPEIAQAFYASGTLGAGQYCTNPGLVILPAGERGEAFVQAATRLYRDGQPGTLLAENVPANIAAGVRTLLDHGATLVTGGHEPAAQGYCFENSLLRVSGKVFLAQAEALQTEVFGPVALLVLADGEDELLAIAERIGGNLTGSIYSHSGQVDEALYRKLEPLLRPRVGRLLNDKMPTGLLVSPAMNHGGPFPATGHPGFTAVGIPASLLRFAALHGYDNVREPRLPPELRDKIPTGSMWRRIDGAWTQGDVPISS